MMQSQANDAITPQIESYLPTLQRLREAIAQVLVGQTTLVDRLLVALIADGHVLLEGLPGLAKTTAVKTLAECIQAKFARISFTPDLLPADLIGTQIYRPHSGEFETKQGPIFTNLLLADEINRAPAKVQSALLEAMQERQVTLGDTCHPLPTPFLVLATQNPIEQEGTYPLPEAQLDRFMLKLKVGYPSRDEEKRIMKRMSQPAAQAPAVVSLADIAQGRDLAAQIYVDSKVEDYIVDVVAATRYPERYNLPELDKLIEVGASPRASINLLKIARAHALLCGRGFVTPQDIKTLGPDVLRHRIIVTYEAEARDMHSDDVITQIFNHIDVP